MPISIHTIHGIRILFVPFEYNMACAMDTQCNILCGWLCSRGKTKRRQWREGREIESGMQTECLRAKRQRWCSTYYEPQRWILSCFVYIPCTVYINGAITLTIYINGDAGGNVLIQTWRLGSQWMGKLFWKFSITIFKLH